MAVQSLWRNSDFSGMPESEFIKLWYGIIDRRMAEAKYASFKTHGPLCIKELNAAFAKEISDEQAVDQFTAFFSEYKNHWRLYDDVLECLQALGRLSLGAISNGDCDIQRDKLRTLNIEHRFHPLITSEKAGTAKPDRQIFLLACQEAGCRPEEALYVGDDLQCDVFAGKNAGLNTVWLKRDALTAGSPPEGTFVISSLLKLPELIDSFL